MTEITIEDLQKLGEILKGSRPMTEQEIAKFGIVPEGAIRYKDYDSYMAACQELLERNVAFESGCNRGKGLYWTKMTPKVVEGRRR